MKKIMVCLKRVVDYNVRIRVRPDGSGVVTEGVKMSINPFDEIALEEALRIRERGHARRSARGLHRASAIASSNCAPDWPWARIARFLIESDDRGGTAGSRAGAAENGRARKARSWCMLGKQAIDDDCNQTGQMLAALWNRPQATFASALELGSPTARRP